MYGRSSELGLYLWGNRPRPTVHGQWVDSPTVRGQPTVHGQWVPLHGGQGSISLEYQTYTSAYPFDTLVTGMSAAVVFILLSVQNP